MLSTWGPTPPTAWTQTEIFPWELTEQAKPRNRLSQRIAMLLSNCVQPPAKRSTSIRVPSGPSVGVLHASRARTKNDPAPPLLPPPPPPPPPWARPSGGPPPPPLLHKKPPPPPPATRSSKEIAQTT